MSDPACAPEQAIGRLCGACGLCCNGALFGTVRLENRDDAAHLKSLGLNLDQENGAACLRLPCPAHDGCSCRVYANRPARCRAFECKLLQEVIVGTRQTDEALRIIERTKKEADTVRRMLRDRGQSDESLSLSRRYQRHLENAADSEGSRQDAELTFAVFQLTQLLQLSFYTERAIERFEPK